MPEDTNQSSDQGDSNLQQGPIVAPIEALVGTNLNQYRILSELGRGAMGVVFVAEDTQTGKEVALKVLPPHISRSNKIIRRFLREAESVAKLDHPNIVKIYGIGHKESIYYYAMELIKGRPLDDILEKEGHMSFKRAAQIIIQACDAIHFAHENAIIHRDIKPGNIIITGDDRVVITDFGLARQEKAATLTESGALVGTPIYMSPEQVLAKRGGVDKRTDIYSLGVTLYQLISGKPPFTAQSTQGILNQILEDDPKPPQRNRIKAPSALCTITLKAMEKSPDMRFQSACFLGDELRRYVAGTAIQSKPAGIFKRLSKKIKKHKIISGLAAVSIVISMSFLAHLILSKEASEKTKAIVTDQKKGLAFKEEMKTIRELMGGPGAYRNLTDDNRERAQKAIDKALPLNPDNSEIHLYKGKFLYMTGDYPNALAEYTLAIKLAPQSWEALLGRGLFLLEQGRRTPDPNKTTPDNFQENAMSLGLIDLRMALDKAPDNPTVAFSLAKTLYEFSAAKDLDPQDDKTLISWAFTHASNAQLLQTNADIECLLAQIYLEFAKYAISDLEKEVNHENAKKCLLRALELNSNHHLAKTLLSKVEKKLNEEESTGLAINAREFIMEEGLGNFYTNASEMVGVLGKDLEEAWNDAEKGKILENIMTVLFAANDDVKAKETMDQAIAMQEERKLDYPALLAKAKIYNGSEEYLQAIRCYKRALIINPKEAHELNYMIGSSYFQSGEKEHMGQALHHARFAYSQEPRNSEYLRLLYRVLLELGDKDGLVKLKEEAEKNGMIDFETWEMMFPGQNLRKKLIHSP